MPVLAIAAIAGLAAAQTADFDAADRKIVRLRPSEVRDVPRAVAEELTRRGCTIPQEAFSKERTNVIHGAFARPGQTDWAVLCSIRGTSSILVFWNGSPDKPGELAAAKDRNYIQGMENGRLVFSRGIGPVGGAFILEHFRAYGGPTPPPIDHEGIDDAFLGKASVVHYFSGGRWLELTGAD